METQENILKTLGPERLIKQDSGNTNLKKTKQKKKPLKLNYN